MVPMAEIPQTLDQLASFARDERYFLTAAVIIASKHHTAKGMKQVHDKAWAVFRVSSSKALEGGILTSM